ncbi:hypothetical protein HNP33_003934 [Comamonas odontotermitis]|uniref:Uncharacterized protein n=1 Tax=Comamonas odontotermitis TaxID=379895 RepID=A0ABR6RKW5_9BURK|nr:hypothetical protein [Comamonas odontotermitis]MBB6579818.1 hypothetical protein [Comamonas odontotermitis]
MWKYAAIGATLFLSSSVAVAEANNWTYTPIGDGQASIFFSMNDQKITSHLYKGKISFCEKTEDFFCFSTEYFNFSIPKKKENRISEWRKNGISFDSKKLTSPIRIMGKEISVYKISSHKPDVEYYYSDFYGLVAFRVKGNEGPLFILEESCGFGSSRLCR